MRMIKARLIHYKEKNRRTPALPISKEYLKNKTLSNRKRYSIKFTDVEQNIVVEGHIENHDSDKIRIPLVQR